MNNPYKAPPSSAEPPFQRQAQQNPARGILIPVGLISITTALANMPLYADYRQASFLAGALVLTFGGSALAL